MMVVVWFIVMYGFLGILWWVYALYMNPDVFTELEINILSVVSGFANVDGYLGQFLLVQSLYLSPFVLGPYLAYALMPKKSIRTMPTITISSV